MVRVHGESTVRRVHGENTMIRVHGESTVRRVHGENTMIRVHGESTVEKSTWGEYSEKSPVGRLPDPGNSSSSFLLTALAWRDPE